MAILDDIYDAVGDDEAWAALPARLAPSLGGRSMTFQRMAPTGLLEMTWSYFDPDMIRFYAENDMAPDDVWHQTALDQARLEHGFAVDDFLNRDTFANTAFFNECIRRFDDDTGACMGGVLRTDEGFISIGVHRSIHAPAFGTEEVARIDAVLPHLRRLVEARQSLENARRRTAISEEVLDALSQAVIVTDGDGKVLLATAGAETILNRLDGFALRGGGVTCTGLGSAGRLLAALRAAARREGPCGDAFLVERPVGAPYRVSIIPPARPTPTSPWP